MYEPVTYEELRIAIERKSKIDAETSGQLAERVLNYFGYNGEMIDNALTPEDRGMFYFLEEFQIISSRYEEETLFTGRPWRVFYWTLDKDKILKIIGAPVEKADSEYGVYEGLPDNVWVRQSA
ncbi:DUF6015 family protein [Candidatus Methanomassiliicoccus intestinalis]|uniref:DUF6015 family protein n=1 Tax=Candidatus Methanomassiliicoccus intestinalis TaxID=1406512 RepID=UPI0037DD0BDE